MTRRQQICHRLGLKGCPVCNASKERIAEVVADIIVTDDCKLGPGRLGPALVAARIVVTKAIEMLKGER